MARNIFDPRVGTLNPFISEMERKANDCPQPGDLTDSDESDDDADGGYSDTEKDCNE